MPFAGGWISPLPEFSQELPLLPEKFRMTVSREQPTS